MVQLSVGMLGSIMVASPEVLVIDNDMCGAILRSVRGVEVESSYLDVGIIEEIVTGEGHYLGHGQTLELMRSEYVYPELGDRTSVDEWLAAGQPSVWSRAQARVAEVVAAGRPDHLSLEAESAIRAAFPIQLEETDEINDFLNTCNNIARIDHFLNLRADFFEYQCCLFELCAADPGSLNDIPSNWFADNCEDPLIG